MRCLLIDNYDSYTYNLFQLLARINGADPVVVANDDPRCLELAAELDCVVISPGPGDPGNPEDFGRCADVLREATVPVLGVCLGHQGIAAAGGGAVERAPAARHGHVSRVRHTGDELFHGIPQDFRGVRYHSLRVPEPLPGHLEATAWAEDGVLMGLRHRHRPIWGVQFHPESVLTEYGARLLANFRHIAERHHRRPAARATGPRQYTAHLRSVPLRAGSEAVYHALFGGSRHTMWLDSARHGPGLARFSYLAEASPAHGEVLTYRVGEGEVAIETVGAGTRRVTGTILEVLDRELRRRTVHAPELPFDFTGGFIGYLGYEVKADCGASAKHSSEVPDAVWMFPDRFAVADHADGTLHLVALSVATRESERAATGWLDRAATTAGALTHPPRPPRPGPAGGSGVMGGSGLRAVAEAGLVRGRARYLADVRRCQDELLAGESYEICLTNAVRLPPVASPLRFYGRMRARNPAPYAAYLSAGGVQVACSSPERFLTIDRGRVVESKPIKGTAPRGGTEAEDERLRTTLAGDPKSRAENLMIVDLLRNDLGRVCEPGSVHVPALMQVESYQTVHQLVSTIRGSLRPGASAVDCLRACFPGGSMTGAPKLRTMEIIDELETEARGPYSGTIGFLGCNGTADLNITIRTAVFTPDGVRIGAGGAVVLDSDPVAEYEEMLLKACAPLLGLAEETTPGNPATGAPPVADGPLEADARSEAGGRAGGGLPEAAR
ncbi:aminodeoxychorismate synthase component I [Nonomuraea candida]|uniref:aminodeoxychorismate synthase component I n=1 Tax=Nonomuraea candida TaxID=359159 RepID=UPI0005B95D10|nr:aminodeoxychorismate synthase component I [Nonomuraea candida]